MATYDAADALASSFPDDASRRDDVWGRSTFSLLRPVAPCVVLRYFNHLVLALLLYVVVSNVAAIELPTPSLDYPELAPPESMAEVAISPSEIQVTESTRYLERHTSPLTMRVIREILPESRPQRAVRTSVIVYKVQSGDTVLDIASKFGLEGSSLLWANENLADNPDFLRLGQELYILPVDGAYHTVLKGETIAGIAKRYQVEPEAIYGYKGNDLEVSQALVAGSKLIIPGGIRPYVPRRVFAYDGEVPANAQQGSGSFVWPMSGHITQRYWQGHRAIDIGAPKGTPIVATDSGYVAVAQYSDVGYGRMIIIDHGNGYQSLYGHLNAYFVEVGQSVGKGEMIGHCGSTGNSTGPHLHFEVIKSGVRRNPLNYLP